MSRPAPTILAMLIQTLALLSLSMLLAAHPRWQIPEPAAGTALLCGLLVIGYMAWRRSRWPEG